MTELVTPDAIIRQLVDIRAEASKGIEAQYAAERELADAVLALDTAEAQALLDAQGTVVDRQAVAKLRTTKEREAEGLARAKYNRVKTKLRLLEQAQMSVQTQARLVELMYKSAGIGER